MPRGFSKDERVSALLVESGFFENEDSFIGYDLEMTPHLLLEGEDVSRQRTRLWKALKYRPEGRACGICHKPITNPDWEMDHIQGGTVGRCDCLHNLRAVHRYCHREKHVKTQLKSIPLVMAERGGREL
jgi:HNH endonuclease